MPRRLRLRLLGAFAGALAVAVAVAVAIGFVVGAFAGGGSGSSGGPAAPGTSSPVKACAGARAREAGTHVPRPTGPGRVTVLQMRTPDSSHRLRPVWVYRPAVPDGARLPVLYALHGDPGSAQGLFENARIAGYLDRAFAAGEEPFVLVAPDGNGAHHEDTEWADSVDGRDRIESFVTRVVLRGVEGRHPRDRCHRAIAGFSMGGYGAMNLALRHPSLFGQVASIAGYFHVDDPSGVFGHDAAAQAANSPEQNVERARDLSVFLLDAEGEDLPLIRGQAMRFTQLLAAEGIPVTLSLAPGRHTPSYAAAQNPALLTFLEAGWHQHVTP